ncbi:MAG: dihydrolipoyl dehydrogenase [Candidatus Ratteibacteria bacterium]|nr:dihydrolipoyl dehydrogenase [Candidatus Ratteibacteria bacterium]
MIKQTFDLAVLGAGPGGYAAAIRAAQLGKKVALIEKGELGGVCLHKGCIPTKTFLEYVETLKNIEKANDWGINLEVKSTNFQRFLARRDKTLAILVNGLRRILLSYKIEIYQAEGSLVNPNTLELKEAKSGKSQRLRTSKLIIATGSSPKIFPPFDFADKNLITSEGAIGLKKIPPRIIIIGGGIIGCEFASIYAGLGTEVILVEIENHLLPQEDREIARRLEAIFRRQNIEIHLRSKTEKIERKNDTLYLELSNGKIVSGEKVLISLGRTVNSRIKGLKELGLKLNQGGITVNNRMETNIAGVYAVGDVLGGPFLAHLAYQQGLAAAENAFGGRSQVDSKIIPSGIYTLPEIGRVGLTEEEALKRGIKIKVGRYPFAALSRAVISNERRGLFKIISDQKNGRILGVHILGKRATDLIGEAVLAIHSGLTAKDLAGIIHAHPTFYEGIRSAAEDVNGEAIHLPR